MPDFRQRGGELPIARRRSLPSSGGSLRQDGRRTPILMLTARDMIEDRVRGFDAGADEATLRVLLRIHGVHNLTIEAHPQAPSDADLRAWRTFRVGNVSVRAHFDIFSTGNADTVVSLQNAVSPTYLATPEILALRVIRVEVRYRLLIFSGRC